jgi:hypothetical protein
MRPRIGVTALVVAALVLLSAGDLLACGDKYLSSGRGTRYQRPKSARAASILIYANPSTDLPAAMQDDRVQLALKHAGHRATTVQTLQQLSAVLQGGRFDVVLAASAAAVTVQQLLTGADAAVLVALDSSPGERKLLQAIDKAVEQHDRNTHKAQSRT